MSKIHVPSVAYESALAIANSGKDNLEVARNLLGKAADAGDARARYALASWHLFGQQDLIAKDERKAIKMMLELAEFDIAEVQFNIAYAYDEGKFLRRSERKAFAFYMKAALLGDRDSCVQIAEFFREGKLVRHDMAISAAWQARATCNEREIAPPYRIWLS